MRKILNPGPLSAAALLATLVLAACAGGSSGHRIEHSKYGLEGTSGDASFRMVQDGTRPSSDFSKPECTASSPAEAKGTIENHTTTRNDYAISVDFFPDSQLILGT